MRRPKAQPATSTAVDAPNTPCGAAILDVVRLTLELTSANEKLDFPKGARIRGELERALPHAQALAEALPVGRPRSAALDWLENLRTLADRQLVIAPRPTAAAIEAADAGDPSVFWREADAWAAVRLGSGMSRSRPRRRTRTDTSPGTPGALRNESDAGKEQGLARMPPASKEPDDR
jgi:hypothetical protein